MNTSILLNSLGFPTDNNYDLCYETSYESVSCGVVNDSYSQMSNHSFTNTFQIQDNLNSNTSLIQIHDESIDHCVQSEVSHSSCKQYDAETLIALGFPIDKCMGDLYEENNVVCDYSNELISSFSTVNQTEEQDLDYTCHQYHSDLAFVTNCI